MRERDLRIIVLCGVFLLPFIPLLVIPTMYFPSLSPKDFAFRIIIEVITGAWLPLAIVYKKYRPTCSILIGAFTLFVTVMAIADIHGVDPYHSFWGNYAHMDGWLTLIHILAYVVVVSSVVTKERTWRLLFHTSLGVSVLVGIFGIFQVAGVLPLNPGGPAGPPSPFSRIDATLANPSYLAVYMLFHIFIALLLWYQHWNLHLRRRRTLSLVYSAIIIIDTATLLFTGTRTAIVALTSSVLIALILLSFAAASFRSRMLATTTLVTILALATSFFLLRDSRVIQNIQPISRLANISLTDPSIQMRLFYMNIAWQATKEHPLLGCGQENYILAYQKHYDPQIEERDTWPDRVHNILGEWLVAGGFLGLVTYMTIFGAALWVLWRKTLFDHWERIILSSILVAYFINNLALFDTTTSYMLFATVLAYILCCERQKRKSEPSQRRVPTAQTALSVPAAIVLSVMVIVIWQVNGPAMAANMELAYARMTHDTLDKRL